MALFPSLNRTPARMALLALVGSAALSIPAWAAKGAAPGIPNFHQVNERIYRGAQPRGAGWDSLAKLGIKTVIDLRPDSEHSSNTEKLAVEAAGMHYVNLPLSELRAPSDKQVSKALALMEDSASPVFVHCRRGADRTGTLIACYRIAHDGWTNRRALKEAESYGMSWLEFGMQRYVLAFHPAAASPPPLPAPPLPPR
jgi:tyrosine-protein phosphatase SIW14